MAVRTLREFHQGSDFGIYRLGNVQSGGVCAAMSIQYLVERSRGNDFWGWFDAIGNKVKLINTHGGGKGVNEYMQIVYNTMSSEMLRQGSKAGVSFGSIIDWMTKDIPIGNQCHYRWICMEVPSTFFFRGGGHAFAIQLAPTLRFFDPNFGEYEFDDLRADFYNWMAAFLTTNYRDNFKRATVEIQFMDALGSSDDSVDDSV